MGFAQGGSVMQKKRGSQRTFFTVAPKNGSFHHEMVLPGGERVWVMKRRVFDEALLSADRKLEEIVRARREKEAAA